MNGDTAIRSSSDDVLLAWPTPILREIWPIPMDAIAALRNLILNVERKGRNVTVCNVGAWHSDEDLLEWGGDEVDQVRTCIGRSVGKMLNMHRCNMDWVARNVEVKASAWANISRDGEYQNPHVHAASSLAGVFYVEVGLSSPGKPRSGMIEFYDPRHGAGMRVIPTNPFGTTLRFKPEVGLMLMFPSWLLHFVNPFFGQKERISIGFNVTIKSTTGWSGHFNVA